MKILRTTSLVCALGAVFLGVGCSDGAETAAPVTTPARTGALPADVARVIQAQCVSCHTTTPRYGAPMPMVTYADTQRGAVTAPSRAVWQLMGERIHDAVRPMPASRLNPADMAVIDNWVRAGAPPCTGESCGTVNPNPAATVTLPCTPSHTFNAHAMGATTGFTVPAASGNLNKCFAFQSPFTAATQAIAFGPRIDNASVLHHMILFQTETRQTDGAVFNCDGNMPRDARFVTGWAPGNMGTVLPSDVGVGLPNNTNTWFILQVHYWNLQNSEAVDNSGLSMCTTTELRAHNAAITTLGSLDIAIPPRAQGHDVVGNCTPALTEPVHIIGSGPHMHRLGTALRTEIIRRGSTGGANPMLVNVENYTFDSQVSYRNDELLMPGDSLRTTCRYNNPGSRTVYFGERTEDEMCFNFVLAWPAGALANSAGAGAYRCIDHR